MSDFVSHPLDKLMNRENIFSRVEKVERKVSAQPSATAGQLSEIAARTGDLIVDGSLAIANRENGETIIIMDTDGQHMDADTYPSSARLDWIAVDNNVTIGELVASYGGALTNSGLLLLGYAHDSSVSGLISLRTHDHNGVNKVNFTIDTRGIATVDLRNGTETAKGEKYLTILTDTAETSALNAALYLQTRSTGTVTNGLGTSIVYEIEDSAGNVDGAGYTGVSWTDKTSGSEDAEFTIGLMKAGAVATALTLDTPSGLTVVDNSIRSRFISGLADDTATSFTPAQTVGSITVLATAGAGNGGMGGYNTITGAAVAHISGANFVATSGILAGTTGTDGKLTISAHTDGKIYIENRTGATRNITVTLG